MIIFDLTNPDWKYKGVLFAELDNDKTFSEPEFIDMPSPPKNFIVGVMGIIWTDEKDIWNLKLRFKLPSGIKQVMGFNFKNEQESGVNVNETYILQSLYKKIPMKNKTWTKNPAETPMGILEIIQKLDMIESMTVVKNNKTT